MVKKLYKLISCNFDVDICGVVTNSKEVKPGFLFICTMGAKVDRHDYISQAIENGAAALIVSRDVEVDIPYVKVDDTNVVLPKICKRFYDDPISKLKILAVTGTDGKTSVASMVSQLIGQDVCAYLGTNGLEFAGKKIQTMNTTPAYEYFCKYAYSVLEAGCKYLCVEASSEAMQFGRLDFIDFSSLAVTNIKREHLNTHGTLENYIACKMDIISKISDKGNLILNMNDDHFNEVKQTSKAKVFTYGTFSNCDLEIVHFVEKLNCTEIVYSIFGNKYKIVSPLIGSFNVENLACALLLALSEGFQLEMLFQHLTGLSVAGRMEVVALDQDFRIIIDFAHTINGIKSVLEFALRTNHNRIIVVTGQAGEKDSSNRPIVGKLLEDMADFSFLTSDDNTAEDENKIVEQILSKVSNLSKFSVELDRAKAIEQALEFAEKGDIVLILGKGNDNYIRTRKGKVPYSDFAEVKRCLQK